MFEVYAGIKKKATCTFPHSKLALFLKMVYTQNMAKKSSKKRTGRPLKNNAHLVEVRANLMAELGTRGFLKKDIAFIFNVDPSQVSRFAHFKRKH